MELKTSVSEKGLCVLTFVDNKGLKSTGTKEVALAILGQDIESSQKRALLEEGARMVKDFFLPEIQKENLADLHKDLQILSGEKGNFITEEILKRTSIDFIS